MTYRGFKNIGMLLVTLMLISANCDSSSGGNTDGTTGMTDSEIVSADASSLAIGYGNGDSTTQITGNVTLPITGENGSTITWSSSDPNIIANDGTYTSPVATNTTGYVTITLTATITSGSSSQTVTFTLYVYDTVAPAVPSAPVMRSFDDKGASNSDNITSQATFYLTGTCDTSSRYIYFYLPDGTQVGYAFCSSGTYSGTASVTEGIHDITATAIDYAWNESAASAALTVTVDTTPPVVTFILDPVDDSGISNTDMITNQISALTFMGTTEPGSIVQLFKNSNSTGSPVTADASGNWSIDINVSGLTTTYLIDVKVTDVAGNITWPSTANEKILSINLTLPTVSIPDLPLTHDTGISSTDNITNATAVYTSIPFNGTATAGASIELLKDGIVVGTPVVAAADGTWTVITASSDFPDGTYFISARATEPIAGNVKTSSSLYVMFDTVNQAPSVPDLDAASDSGLNNTDNITVNTTLTFNGTSERSSAIQLYVAGVATGTPVTADNTGNWSKTITVAAGATYAITATATDAAGNGVSVQSAPLNVTVNAVTPPTILSAETMDADNNGYIDHYKITFSEPVNDSTFPGYVLDSGGNASGWMVSNHSNVFLAHGAAAPAIDTPNDSIIYLSFQEGPTPDTGNKPDLTTTSIPGLTDIDGSVISQVFTATVTETDRVNPVLVSARSKGETLVRALFSEVVTAATAENITNYSVTGLTISSAVMEGGAGVNDQAVILTSSLQTAGVDNYTLTVTSGVVQDLANLFLTTPLNTTVFSGFSPGLLLSAVGGNGQVTLSWNPPAAMTSYTLYWSTSPGVTIAAATAAGNKITGVTSPYVHMGRTNGTPSYYILTGTNAALESAPSSEVYGIAVNYSNTFTNEINALSVARAKHTATLLSDGRVLITGGESTPYLYNATTEIYDPVTGTFTAAANMSTARTNHTATLLTDGRVFITGGKSTASLLNSTEIYDPGIDTFTPGPTMSTARSNHTATLLSDGRVLIVGGFNTLGGIQTAEIYDPAANTFSTAISMTIRRYDQTATLLSDGRVLVTGGSYDANACLSTTEIYDPVTNAFTSGVSMSVARSNHTATLLLDGRILLTGGRSSNSNYSNPSEFYDFASNTLSPSIVVAGANHAATLLSDGNVLITGGDIGTISSSYAVSTSILYDPAADAIVSSVSLDGIGRYFHTATLLSTGEVLIAGGKLNATFNLKMAKLFDPVTSSILPAPYLSIGKSEHTATLLSDGRVFISGGMTSSTDFIRTTEIYDPVTATFIAGPSMSTPRAKHVATLLSDGRVLITGGQSSSTTYQSSSEIYDPVTNTFTAAASMYRIRYNHTATLLSDGRVLITGFGSADIYDPVSNTITLAAQMAVSRVKHTATLLADGRVLIAGGYNVSSIELYDPDTNTFSAGPAMLVARYDHTATLLSDGRVLMAGGSNSFTTFFYNSTEIYDPISNTFSAGPAMSATRYNHTATILADGRILITGGNSASDTTDIYDALAATQTAGPLMTSVRTGHSGTMLLNGSVLYVGGVNDNTLSYYYTAQIFQ